MWGTGHCSCALLGELSRDGTIGRCNTCNCPDLNLWQLFAEARGSLCRGEWEIKSLDFVLSLKSNWICVQSWSFKSDCYRCCKTPTIAGNSDCLITKTSTFPSSRSIRISTWRHAWGHFLWWLYLIYVEVRRNFGKLFYEGVFSLSLKFSEVCETSLHPSLYCQKAKWPRSSCISMPNCVK